jgi:hypothetical protein
MDGPAKRRPKKATKEHQPAVLLNEPSNARAITRTANAALEHDQTASNARRGELPLGHPAGLQRLTSSRQWLDGLIAIATRLIVLAGIVTLAVLAVVALFHPSWWKEIADFLEQHWHFALLIVLLPLILLPVIRFLERVERVYGLYARRKKRKERVRPNPRTGVD